MGTRTEITVMLTELEDHPHAYGDKLGFAMYYAHRQGSSPRVWGQDLTVTGVATDTGIIPTRMGTSPRFCAPVFFFKDHPHAYGDK